LTRENLSLDSHSHLTTSNTMFNQENTYWNNNGKHQAIVGQLNKLIPDSGECPKTAPKLEIFRQAANCYHDFYNNALCNRVDEFKEVFGFIPDGFFYSFDDDFRRVIDGFDRERFFSVENESLLESKIDSIILEAATEQKIYCSSNRPCYLVTYSDGDTVETEMNCDLAEATAYFKSFDRITEDFETGKETAAKCISVSLIS